MAGKRKSRAGTSKQVTPEPEDTQSSSLPEDMWIAEAILDQRGKGTQVEYCIHWAGVDPDTGKPWSPTWQRRADCTVPLLDEWETKKSADPGIVGRYRREQEKLKKVGKGKRKRSTISSSVVPSHTRSPVKLDPSASPSAGGSKGDMGPPPKKKARGTSGLTTAEVKDEPEDALEPEDAPLVEASPEQPPSGRPSRLASSSRTPQPNAVPRPRRAPPSPPPTATAIPPRSKSSSSTVAPRTHSPSAPAPTTAPIPAKPISTSSARSKSNAATMSETPATAPSAGPSDSGLIASSSKGPSGNKKLGPVPQPSPSVFKMSMSMASSSRLPEPQSQSTQSDKIGQFSSPPSTMIKNRSKGKGKEKIRVILGDDSDSDVEKNVPSGSKPCLQQKIIDGELWTVDSESLDDDPPLPTRPTPNEGPGPSYTNGRADHSATVEPTEGGDVDELDDEDAGQDQGDAGDMPPMEPFEDHAGSVYGEDFAEGDFREDDDADGEDRRSRHSRSESSSLELNDSDLAIIDGDTSARRPSPEPPTGNDAVYAAPLKIISLSGPTPSAPVTKAQTSVGVQTIAEPPRAPTPVAPSPPPPAPAPVISDEVTAKIAAIVGAQSDSEDAGPAVPSDPETAINLLLDHITKQSEDLDEARENLDTARQSNENLDQSYGYIQKQYRKASESAVREVEKNRELEAKVKTLQEQLTFGLKQRDLHAQAIKAKRGDELVKLEKQNAFLLAQARLTGDAIRHKATEYDRMKAQYAVMEVENARISDQARSLAMRNEDLNERIRVQNARAIGVFGDPDSEGSEASFTPVKKPKKGKKTKKVDPDETDNDPYVDSPPVPPAPASPVVSPISNAGSGAQLTRAALSRQTRSAASTLNVPNSASAPASTSGSREMRRTSSRTNSAANRAARAASSNLPTEAELNSQPDITASLTALARATETGNPTNQADETGQTVDGGTGFWCKWTVGRDRCPMIFDTKEVSGKGNHLNHTNSVVLGCALGDKARC